MAKHMMILTRKENTPRLYFYFKMNKKNYKCTAALCRKINSKRLGSLPTVISLIGWYAFPIAGPTIKVDMVINDVSYTTYKCKTITIRTQRQS